MDVPSLKHERELWDRGNELVVGVDEVGRGCLAGPVAAAAVVFGSDTIQIDGVRDSKQLSSKKRDQLKEIITEKASDWGIGFASVCEIDLYGIVAATDMAMKRAMGRLEPVDHVMVDGNHMPEFDGLTDDQVTAIVGGDKCCYSISAASILAKVVRDEFMVRLNDQYPQYMWHKNKGYGTLEHKQAINQYGLTQWHRKSFNSFIQTKD